MNIGSDGNGNLQANGLIDNFRISDVARTAAQALAEYQSNQPLPVDANTTCLLNFSGNSGNTITLPNATGESNYSSQIIEASGGMAPYTYTVTSGTLPSGITLTGNTLSGTPTNAPPNGGLGTYNFTVTAMDASGYTGSQAYSLTVNAPTITLSSTTLPAGTVGTAYTSTTITATGGTGSYTWSATGLPSGLSIGSTTGTISGTPTSAVGSPFTVQVTATDADQYTDARIIP